MAHRIFLDTNVFLNIILEEIDCGSCTALLDCWNSAEYSSFIESAGASFLSFADIAYVLRKKFGTAQIRRYLDVFRRHLSEILPNDEANLLAALESKGPDFEDVLQYVCAVQNGYDIIVTCNKRHFERIEVALSNSDGCPALPVIMTPQEVLRELVGN